MTERREMTERRDTAGQREASEHREADPRARILRAASDLFRRYGFQAVGVDTIVEESGVAKMTLYRNFRSKDDLIVEFLNLEDADIRKWLRRVTDGVDEPKGKLRAFFESLGSRTSREACPGCPFQIAAGEFPDPDHPVHRRGRAHKRRLREELAAWVRAAGLNEAERTTNQLYLLMEGSWAEARMRLNASTSGDLAGAAVMLIEGGLYVQAVAGSSPTASTNHD